MKTEMDSTVEKAKEEFCKLDSLISREREAGNPLAQELAMFVDGYKALLGWADNMANENQRMKRQLMETSRSLELTTRVDPMTGLSNRRDILGKIEQEFSRAQRHHRTFSIILGDIDDFRKLNEKYGFNVGDEVLVEIANVIRVCIRGEDICSRWSGEQFLLLLPETGIEGAESVAQKICQTISMSVFRVNKPGIRVTMSMGVSVYNREDTMFQCISRADNALIQAKSSGKNCFAVAPLPDQTAV